MWLLTAPKVGSDLNYQIEMMLVLSICAACALSELDFFESVFTARRTWVTLLQIPLLLHVVMNVVLTARVVAERLVMEPFRRQETSALKPYVDRPGRLFSVHYDSLVHYRGSIEVEPLIYSLLVATGRVDPAPVLNDLEARQFETVVLGEDLFAAKSALVETETDAELPHLPPAQIDAIRRNYKVVRHVDGPNGVYVYEPKRD